MNRSKERFVENFIFIMFPVALLVACTTNGTDQQPASVDYTTPSSYELTTSELDAAEYIVSSTYVENNDNEPSIDSSSEDQYIIVSPSMHLAVYKTTRGVEVDMSKSIQTAHLKESNAISFPNKSVFQFDSDTYNVYQYDLGSLKDHAQFLANNPQFNLTVSGHTDHTGSKEHNQLLSEQRAQLVMDILITFGAPTTQIIIDGYGETIPLNAIDNLDENRRVELEYSKALLISTM